VAFLDKVLIEMQQALAAFPSRQLFNSTRALLAFDRMTLRICGVE
jgi:hypothetical protein